VVYNQQQYTTHLPEGILPLPSVGAPTHDAAAVPTPRTQTARDMPHHATSSSMADSLFSSSLLDVAATADFQVVGRSLPRPTALCRWRRRLAFLHA